MRKLLSRIIVSLVLFIVLAAPIVLAAQGDPTIGQPPAATPAAPAPGTTTTTTTTTTTGIPVGGTLPGNLPRLGLDELDMTDPVKAAEFFMLNYIIKPIFWLSGGVAIIMIMYSSFQIITARGEEEGITGAKTTLLWAFVGLGLVVLAYTIVSNVASIILGLASGT